RAALFMAAAMNFLGAHLGIGEKVLTHRSGRPWLLGQWPGSDIVQAESAHARVALLGTTAITEATLAERLRRIRSVCDLDSLARSIPGSFHLIGSVNGTVRVQGTISTARQIFYGTVMGITVAADRPQSLAELTGAGIDEERLALHLLTPFGAPWPLNEVSMWKGIRALTPGHYLEISADGTRHQRNWWTPPEPELSLADGAALVRDALEGAIAARSRGTGVLSSDFSGGMDSTSLCFLAAGQSSKLVTVHYEGSGSLNDDKLWADRCKDDLPNARHLTVPRGTGPALYSPLSEARLDLEGPLPLARPRARIEHVLRLAAEAGSTRHMQGTGGDELFFATTTCLNSLSRQHPRRSVPHIRAAASRYRWNLATTVRQMSAIKPYPRWLAQNTDRLTDQRVWGYEAGWELALRMPPWATEEAVRTARRLIHEAVAEGPEPFSPLPAQHEMIRAIQANGWILRGLSRIAEQFGVLVEAPYTDDRVLEAALSVRLEDRLSPTHMKPVLAAAMRGLVPHVLDRQTKADGSTDIYAGLRKHRQELWALCEDSHLARMGLIDPEAIRPVLFGEHADARPFMPFDSTLGVELWLRSTANREGAS
ncbi:asparagine synthase-related protein, partial [Streptosporangium sp. NPDC048865]|uniref:asparagine synthase-related protein n=1 Tax=Streptosporangium sp. NPDC048865 TaxID=3155766 RepID=UPI0034363C86